MAVQYTLHICTEGTLGQLAVVEIRIVDKPVHDGCRLGEPVQPRHTGQSDCALSTGGIQGIGASHTFVGSKVIVRSFCRGLFVECGQTD